MVSSEGVHLALALLGRDLPFPLPLPPLQEEARQGIGFIASSSHRGSSLLFTPLSNGSEGNKRGGCATGPIHRGSHSCAQVPPANPLLKEASISLQVCEENAHLSKSGLVCLGVLLVEPPTDEHSKVCAIVLLEPQIVPHMVLSFEQM
jgi:hypothetical protein